jgi:hypothetical protein
MQNGNVTHKDVGPVYLHLITLANNWKEKRSFKRRGNETRRVVGKT